ncbi:hypothetical protein GHU79_02590, partial [Pseudomonas aeruginosa]|nr:hypothetical protein [Pseudomonas aeruginosa]
DRNDLGFRIFRADMSADGGGRANYSASVAGGGGPPPPPHAVISAG